jgi:hypothetical protein
MVGTFRGTQKNSVAVRHMLETFATLQSSYWISVTFRQIKVRADDSTATPQSISKIHCITATWRYIQESAAALQKYVVD